ncbi:MAG: prolyl oligopeptidase family serine peptidase [Ignavibacteria bacterium]|nr:prolyl oligopeptidase family serine peptidase [Ignavibacteria bacterium]
MNRLYQFLFLFFPFVYLFSQNDLKHPISKQVPVVDTIFGCIITDYYRWLENKNDPEVQKWSLEQNRFTEKWLERNTKKIPGLSNEIRLFLDRDYTSSPFFKSGREFFFARKQGEKQNKFYTRLKNKNILLLDPTRIDTTGQTSIVNYVLSKNADKVAIGLQTRGNEIARYYFLDTKTGREIAPPLDNVYSIRWCRNENYVYITYRSIEDIQFQKPLKTYIHKLSGESKDDIFLFDSKDAKNFASIWDDEKSNLTFISEGDFFSNTLKIVNPSNIADSLVIFSSKEFRAYPLLVKEGKIYFETNENAPNGKIMVTDVEHPNYKFWKVFIPETQYPKEGFVLTTDYVVVREKRDVLSKLLLYDLQGNFIKEIEPPEFANISGMYYDEYSNSVYISIMSFTTPSKLYRLDGKTLEWTLIFEDKSPIDTKNIETKQVFYYSKDGTRVPMFLCYRKGLKLDGNNPTLLYGYGGFNVSMTPHYLGVNASFVNRGGVYAIACIRGGSEYGEEWHKQGMLDKKQNVFDDFISAAEYLIKEKYTNPSKLAIKGASNGGLLVAAVATQRPDLFKAVICGVPLIDMIRYHKFLIARYWIPEYGDPEKEEDFRNLLKYSPYHNVKFGVNLPSMFIKAGENDTRVDPLHAKKFAALLQNLPWQKNPILLFVDFESGHGSGQSIEQQIKNIEIEYQWLMNILEIY